MHWIVQNNLYHEIGHKDLLDTFDRMSIPYTEVEARLFSSHLPVNERIVPYVEPQGLVMVCGSITLARVASDAGWTPGSFYNENHDYRVWREHWGHNLLNYEAKTCRFADVQPEWEEFFIRPCGDSKEFSGEITDWTKFEDWRKRVIDLKETYSTLDADTMVSYSPVKDIYREARFFVVDGKIATQSTYKVGSKVLYTAEVPPNMIEYADRMVKIWQPARAFVIDIALTDDKESEKIIEVNCINSAGFYAIDMQRFVGAIENMDF
jgi:hypothetical protein